MSSHCVVCTWMETAQRKTLVYVISVKWKTMMTTNVQLFQIEVDAPTGNLSGSQEFSVAAATQTPKGTLDHLESSMWLVLKDTEWRIPVKPHSGINVAQRLVPRVQGLESQHYWLSALRRIYGISVVSAYKSTFIGLIQWLKPDDLVHHCS